MDKASDFGSEDWGFESLRGHIFKPFWKPDWTMLFGYLVNQDSNGPDPIVAAERKRIELPLAMTKRRDFFKLVRSQVLNPGTDQAQEILMTRDIYY